MKLSISTKAAIAFIICSIIQKIIAFFAMPFYTNLLTLEEYSIFSLYSTWYSVFEIIATIGLCNGVINNGMLKYKDDRDSFITSVQSLSSFTILICGLLCVLFWPILSIYIKLPINIVLLIFIQLFFYTAFILYTSKDKYLFKYKTVVTVNLLIALLTNLISIYLIKTNPLNPNNGYLRVVVNVLVYSLFGLYFYILNLTKSKKLFKKEYIKYAFYFSIPLVPYLFFAMSLDQIDSIMISNLCTADKLAIYSFNNQVGLLPNFINAALVSVLTPLIYLYISENKNKDINDLSITTSLLLFMIVLALITVAPEITKILSNHNYLEGINLITPLALTVLIRFVFGFFITIEMYYNKTYLPAISTLIALSITLVLDYLLIPKYGYIVVGYIKLFVYIIMAIIHYLFVKDIYKYNYKILFIILIFGIVLATIISSLYNVLVIRLLLGIVIEILLGILVIKKYKTK